MRVFVDASVFLKLLLDEPGADEAEEILGAIERGTIVGYVTPLVLEEVSFKLLFAKASEILDTRNIWRIREALLGDENVRAAAASVLQEFRDYIGYMLSRGLRLEPLLGSDWWDAVEIVSVWGLLPADALHLAAARRLGVDAVATFDEDFQRVPGVRVVP